MDTLAVSNLKFQGSTYRHYLFFENLKPFTHDFQFGKSYLLAGSVGSGGDALSFIVCGWLRCHQGSITRDGIAYSQRERQGDAWKVRHSQIKRFGFRANQTVRWQVRHGLQTYKNGILQTEQDVIERFKLSELRYHRPLRQLSHEAWRASCAIGFVNGKRIFCFPYINQHEHEFIESYFHSYLKEMIDFLRDAGALVLIPAILSPMADKLCDEVILLNKGLS